MFQGSKNVPKTGHFSLLEAAGGRGGSDINGTTNNDRTNYFEQLPSNQVELALWLEADRMGTLTQTLTQEKLDNQREVVKNERRQSLDNQPYGTAFERIEEALFPEGHPRLEVFRSKGAVLVGDVHPAVAELAGALTPVPGGVGPLTITMLMMNTLRAARARVSR